MSVLAQWLFIFSKTLHNRLITLVSKLFTIFGQMYALFHLFSAILAVILKEILGAILA